MRAEVKEEILGSLEKAVRVVGAQNLDEALATISQVLERLNAFFQTVKNRQALADFFDQVDVQSATEEQFLLVGFRFMPQIVRGLLGDIAGKAAKDLPAPPGGRPHSLTVAQEQEICQFVAGLYGQGVELVSAKKRAGQKFGVSARTVQRVWSNRKNLNPREPTLSDVMQALNLK